MEIFEFIIDILLRTKEVETSAYIMVIGGVVHKLTDGIVIGAGL